MSRHQTTPEGKDPQLWAIAQKRAAFKKQLVRYLVINAFLWAIWYFSAMRHQVDFEVYGWSHFPWPLWVTLGWGVGLGFQFAGAYVINEDHAVEKEYEKLKNKP